MLSTDTWFLDGIQKELPVDHTSLRDLLMPLLNSDKDGQRVCASFGLHELNISQLAHDARRVAASLTSYNLVAICMQPSIELIITLCGVVMHGIPYIPLEPTLPRERIEYILNDSRALLMISDDTVYVRPNSNDIKTLTYSQLCDYGTNIDTKPMEVKLEDTFCLMYTSGSTGQPKGVHLPHRALLNRLFWQWSQFPFDKNDVCCVKTSISFVDSIAEIFAPLLRQVPLVILPKSLLLDIQQLISTISIQHITRIVLVPSLLTILLDYLQNNKMSLLDLRLIVCSGETLALTLVESFFALKQQFSPRCCLLNFYGSTEVMGDVTYEIFETVSNLYDMLSLDGRTSIGYPIYNTRVYIADQDEQGIGELVVAGANVANGYHNIDANNITLLNKFILGDDGRLKFRTGDLGKIWNNRILLYGRNDTQIKIAGNRVDLSEVELVVKRYCNCRQPVVAFVPTDASIVVFLQANEQTIDLDRISLAKYLPSYAVPSRFVTVPQFPLLVSGKINRQQLINSIDTVRETKTKHDPIQSDRVEAFYSALEEVGIPRANADRNFFAAGGSSLTALLFVNKLHRIGLSGLTVERLLSALCLNDILLHQGEDDRCHGDLFFESDIKYQVLPLKQVNKCEALRLIVESFANFGELEALIHRNRADLKQESDYETNRAFDELWPTFVEAGLSFGTVSEDGRLIGISLSVDMAHDVHIDPATVPLFSPLIMMIEAGEEALLKELRERNTLPQSILHNYITAVSPDVEPEQRLFVMYHLEHELLQVATVNRFQAVLASNTSSVTQQLAEHVFKYDANVVLYANQWRDSSGNLAFPHADNSRMLVVSMKHIL